MTPSSGSGTGSVAQWDRPAGQPSGTRGTHASAVRPACVGMMPIPPWPGLLPACVAGGLSGAVAGELPGASEAGDGVGLAEPVAGCVPCPAPGCVDGVGAPIAPRQTIWPLLTS